MLQFLDEVHSKRAQIKTYEPCEIIIVDDGSQDTSVAVIGAIFA